MDLFPTLQHPFNLISAFPSTKWLSTDILDMPYLSWKKPWELVMLHVQNIQQLNQMLSLVSLKWLITAIYRRWPSLRNIYVIITNVPYFPWPLGWKRMLAIFALKYVCIFNTANKRILCFVNQTLFNKFLYPRMKKCKQIIESSGWYAFVSTIQESRIILFSLFEGLQLITASRPFNSNHTKW